MTVYVDPLFNGEPFYHDAVTRSVGARNGHLWCHMFADTREELHALAVRIGLRLDWFQQDKDGGHYDLVPSKRAKAIALGAVEVTTEQAVELWRKRRAEQRDLASRRNWTTLYGEPERPHVDCDCMACRPWTT